MSRDIPKRRAEDEFWDDRMMQPLAHPLVFVSEPVKTGLLDKHGNPIYRLPDEIGFIRFRRTDSK